VASGEHASALATLDPAKLPVGWVVTSSGRLSGVTEPGELSVQYPFPIKDLVGLDDALKYASRQSKARFAVYIGDLGGDTADQRAIEVVYGAEVRGRGAESAAPLGVSAAASAFQEGNLIDGLISAVRVLSAGIARP